MLTAKVRVNNNLYIEVTAEDEVSFFKEISRVQEIFAFSKCGVCGNEDVTFRCRIDKEENEWLEIVCTDHKCRAKLPFGNTKKGNKIFPKTRWTNLSETQQEQRSNAKEYADKHNGYLPNGGWFIYQG